jgi:hypothetical protein
MLRRRLIIVSGTTEEISIFETAQKEGRLNKRSGGSKS